MQLFKASRNTLLPIEKDSFKLEKDIQTLVEFNMGILFGLEFVSTEFVVSKFRIDSLAFDEQNNSFVIVEYKKGHNYSIVDQGYSYLSVMLNNKADFILEYNEKTGKKLKKDGNYWTSSRVIFISPSFNTYQKNSVNFRDVLFELWEIRKFDGDLIALEQYVSNSTESIKQLSKNDNTSAISKVSSEVKVISEEDHVKKLDSSMIPLWNALRERLEEFADTTFDVTQSYVSWKRDSTAVCFIYFQKKDLHLMIRQGTKKISGEASKGYFIIDDPKKLTKAGSWSRKAGGTGHEYTFNISKQEGLDYVIFLLRQKYNSLD